MKRKPHCLLVLLPALFALAPRASAQCQLAELLHPAPEADDFLGTGVGLSDDRAILGAPEFAGGRGEALVYRRDGDAWTFEALLTASNGAAGDGFGSSVDVDGDWAIVGAPSAGTGGSVYFFERQPGGAWVERTLVQSTSDGDFGFDVAIDGDVAVAGDPQRDTALFGPGGGRAYAYRRNGTTWTVEDVLGPAFVAPNARIGYAVDVVGETAVVGAPGNPDVGGAVHYFGGGTGTGGWSLIDTVVAPSGAEDAEFGSAVAMTAPNAFGAPSLVVGARNYSLAVFQHIGAVYLYSVSTPIFPDPPELVQEGLLVSPDIETFSGFGGAVAIATGFSGPFLETRVVVGAESDDGGRGATYLFESSPSGYVTTGTIANPDGFGFGVDVAMTPSRVLVGDWLAAKPLNTQGAGRIFDFASAPCPLTSVGGVVELATGGTVQFTVDAGPGHSGDVYWILGSASGTAPGVDIGALMLPLAVDGYTVFTLHHPNSSALEDTFGSLDLEGRASAALHVPAGSNPGLSGLLLHHAVLVFDSATTEAVLTGPPVSAALL